ncbi:energy-coupling factor transporter ATPase [Evansella sp. AB-P1]|uniref:energy-coupling factor transporter ATPase n=1 Tax=Evansella sp. AB-P1 TaxID=3037653 RepID=UPI00241C905C|nr:energy-coupling factor transporter ATPase [Evansella sp. AB-P1]MDG5788085.1 energy-coupling factor transporter ATPase [Evansella sp. AB-P1]
MQIKAKNIVYKYMPNTPFEREALKQVNVTFEENSYNVIIGRTGSGKSTLIQLINGLLQPTEGKMEIGEYIISSKTKEKDIFSLRRHVGMVFQYPENQLFHDTVLQDVSFGPINFGVPQGEAEEIGRNALSRVGISDMLFNRSPFELSGGQMRRVAIAGVLASEPKILILDEPTAGLDPQGQYEIMELFYEWYKERGDRSVILVTHQMEEAVKYGQNIVVMNNGELEMCGKREEVFQQRDKLLQLGLGIPDTVKLLHLLKETSGDKKINTAKFDLYNTVEELLMFLERD